MIYASDKNNNLYGIVTYKTAAALPAVCVSTYGPFTSPHKVLNIIEKFELIGGKSESNANMAEGLATALNCFDDFEQERDPNIITQKYCILICNSAPYSMVVQECYEYENKNVEQLLAIFQERNINLSIISPRKIPVLFKLFEKSGGDLSSSTTKNYCKDPRHLVLLRGFSLKERAVSPPPNANIASLPSPSPAANANQNQEIINQMPPMVQQPCMPNNPGIRPPQVMPGQQVPNQMGMNQIRMAQFQQQQQQQQQNQQNAQQMMPNQNPVAGMGYPQQQQQAQRWMAPSQNRPNFMQPGGQMQTNMVSRKGKKLGFCC